MKSPVAIFCGKGGVGKTTLSLAFGISQARQGRRVIVVTSHPLRELAVSVSLAGLEESDSVAAANLFIIHIDPREILADTVKQRFPSKLLAEAVLSSRLYQSLVEVAPGLKEVAFLSRLRELAETGSQNGNETSFERVIWDAPATGHFLETLKASKQFDTYLTGPFAATGRELSRFFSEKSNLALFPVTTLEEMAVEETIELCEKLVSEFEVHPSRLVCNLVSPLLSIPEETFLDLYDRLVTSESDRTGLKFILDRHRIERQRFHRLQESVRGTFHLIGRVQNWRSDAELLLNLADRMKEMSPA